MIERGTGGKIHQYGNRQAGAASCLWPCVLRDQGGGDQPDTVSGANLIEHGINVNAISPGVVDGEHWDGVDAFFAKHENKAPGQKKREVGANAIRAYGAT